MILTTNSHPRTIPYLIFFPRPSLSPPSRSSCTFIVIDDQPVTDGDESHPGSRSSWNALQCCVRRQYLLQCLPCTYNLTGHSARLMRAIIVLPPQNKRVERVAFKNMHTFYVFLTPYPNSFSSSLLRPFPLSLFIILPYITRVPLFIEDEQSHFSRPTIEQTKCIKIFFLLH